MAKEKANNNGEEKPAAVYFKSLTIRDVRCFKGEHSIDLSDGEGKPVQWTVILGNNNTGKTTLLKCLAGLEATMIPINEGGNRLDCSPIIMFPPHNDLISQLIKVSPELLTTKNVIESVFKNGFFENYHEPWEYDDFKGGVQGGPLWIFEKLRIEAYGASRKMATASVSSTRGIQRHGSLFQNSDLFNSEEWLIQLNVAKLQGNPDQKLKAAKIIGKATEILTSGLLPDVQALQFSSEEKGQSFDNFIEFQTDFGWVRLRDLGYGYQTMLAWVLDLVRRMFERYPESKNPIQEPAIVLVDEIDLHLHPEWQRKIISHLTKYFPNTQFIVTAHSPLVVQSAENINLVLLEKDGDHVNITQPEIKTYKGWTLEEILTELMGLGERTHSEAYLQLIHQFDEALDKDDFETAQAAYNELDKILHPQSNQLKLLRLQMSSLTPA